MPVQAKCTFFLSYKAAGASFSLYKQTDSLGALKVPDAGGESPIDKVLKAMMPLLGYDVQCPFVRISDTAIRGDSEFYDTVWTVIIPAASISSGAPGKDGNPAKNKFIIPIVQDWPGEYNDAVLCPLFASSTQKGRIFLPFYPDKIYQNPIGLNPPTQWVNQFNTFKKVLKDGAWAIRCLTDEVTEKPFEIRKIFRGASGDNLSLQTFANFAVDPGKMQIRVSRCTKKQFNRIYVVESQFDATTVVLKGTAGATVGTLATDGFVRRRVFVYPTIQDADWRRATTRKRGRPFAAPVGRRKRPVVLPLT